MRYTIAFLMMMMLLCSCQPNHVEFHFQEDVRVIRGFYAGCEGKVMDMTSNAHRYKVSIPDCKGFIVEDWFRSSDLKRLK